MLCSNCHRKLQVYSTKSFPSFTQRRLKCRCGHHDQTVELFGRVRYSYNDPVEIEINDEIENKKNTR